VCARVEARAKSKKLERTSRQTNVQMNSRLERASVLHMLGVTCARQGLAAVFRCADDDDVEVEFFHLVSDEIENEIGRGGSR